jgi:hypothetical protein
MNYLKLNAAGKDFLILKLTSIRWKWVFILVGIAYLLALLPIFISMTEGNFNNSNLEIDALRDLGYYDQFFFLLPFFIVFIPYYLKGLSSALNSLTESGVVTINEDETIEVEKYSEKLFGHWMITLTPFAISILFIILDVFTYILAGKNTWNSAAGLANVSLIEIINILLVFFMFYLITALFLRIVLTYFLINRFLCGRVDIQPLHPDNCGGLSPLGEFSLRLTKAGIFIGIPILLGILSNIYQHGFPLFSPVNILMFGGYIISLSVVFFLPLLGARKSMIIAKKKELKIISDYFQSERKDILSNYSNGESAKNLEISNLEGLMKLYEIAKAMPVYPFNSMNLIRFLSSILWPIGLIMLQFILRKF